MAAAAVRWLFAACLMIISCLHSAGALAASGRDGGAGNSGTNASAGATPATGGSTGENSLASPNQTEANIHALSPQDEISGDVFGDWGGLRTTLQNLGIGIDLRYISATASVVAGGRRTGIDYAGWEQAIFNLDFGKIAGVQGLTAHADFIHRSGRNASYDLVGDNLFRAQYMWDGTYGTAVFLEYLYLEQKLFNGTLILRAGRMPMILDFGLLPDSCDFMAQAVCATWGIGSTNSFITVPSSSWAGMIDVKVTDDLSFKAGVYQIGTRFGAPTGFYWGLNGATGVSFPMELSYITHLGPNGLPGIIKIGGYVDTSQYDNFYDATNGVPLPLTSAPPRQSRRAGFYALAQQRLWYAKPGTAQGITGLIGYTHNTSDISVFQNFAFVALLDQGIIPSRPNDRAGLSLTWVGVSHALTNVQELQSDLGLPLSNSAPGVQTTEYLLEANYDISVYRGLHIMPDLQYVIHPSGTHAYPNALVLGFMIRARF